MLTSFSFKSALGNLKMTAVTLVLLGMAVSSLAFWLLQGRAHYYPDAPAGQFACLSYTPPSDTARGVAVDIHAQIENDMQQLSARTRCVRTYSVMNGLDYVPVVARKLHMRVLLGIWIGSSRQANELEIQRAIAIAKEYKDVIDALVVGNEVLLRREQRVEALYQLLKRVHAATGLPVTYADVWDFWLKNPQLAEVSDFITIHILPYWDDQPIGVDHAMQHVANIYNQLQRTFPGRHIYVGETGWPSIGRQRESATPSLLNQARFTREFIAFADAHTIPYNFIEAYDQPWKKGLEGTVGGYWGLYDAEGHAKFPLVGAVVADTQWWRGPLAGLVGAALLLPLIRLRRVSLSAWQAALAGFCLGALGVMQWDYLWHSNRNWQEWLAMSSWMLIAHGVWISNLLRRRGGWASGLEVALLFGLAYINLGLVFDARYRNFPSLFLVMPALLMIATRWRQTPRQLSADMILLCTWVLLAAVIISINEGISNGSAQWWCALCALLSGSLLWHGRTGLIAAHPQQRAEHQPRGSEFEVI